jgi:ABC-type branched-subunit amino acid transport system substrate-binding protein
VLVPLTGQLAPFGGPGGQAAQLAGEQVNAAATAAGVDLSLELIQEDTKTDPQGAQEAATKLIDSDGVAALAGPWATGETTAVAENVSVAAGIPVVTPSATLPEITDLEDDGLVFRTAPSDALQGQVLAQVMAEEIGTDTSVTTASRNDAYGNALVREFTAAWEAAGGSVANNVSYNPEAPSVNSEAGQIVSGSPGAWMIIDYADAWGKMGPALVRTGQWDPARTFTGDGLRSNSLPEATSEAATEGMRGTAPTSLEAPAGAAFDALWTSEIGEPRQTYDSNNFDAVIMIALAAAAAGSADPADIAEQLPNISKEGTKYTFENLQAAFEALQNGEDIDYEGASGPLDFDDNGDPTASNYGTWEYTNGELVDTDQVISFGAAEAEAEEDAGAETSG